MTKKMCFVTQVQIKQLTQKINHLQQHFFNCYKENN